MTEEKAKQCPLFRISETSLLANTGYCIEEYCAWWDDKNKQCILITIARGEK